MNIFNLIPEFINLFRKGESLDNPVLWKNIQNFGNEIGAFILIICNIATDLHHPLPIDQVQAMAIGGVIAAIWNVVLTYATTDKIGLLPARVNITANTGIQGNQSEMQQSSMQIKQIVNEPEKLSGQLQSVDSTNNSTNTSDTGTGASQSIWGRSSNN